VAHNLANANATGYKAEEHRLRAVQVQSQAAREGTADAQFRHRRQHPYGFHFGGWPTPGVPLDMAVQGEGWIALQMPDGSEAYTRNGSFELNVNGVSRPASGIPVQGDGGPISVPPEVTLSIGKPTARSRRCPRPVRATRPA
jgi:flagellar basal-body rod protein FlgF